MDSTTTRPIFIYCRHWPRLVLLLVVFCSVCSRSLAQNGAVTTTQSFSYTGQIVTWTVPTGVTSLTIEARGAEGGDIVNRQASAGKGAIMAAQVSVTPGQALSILVGQSLNGQSAGGGGSFVVGPGATPSPLVIAGGGGGASFYGGDTNTKHGQPATSGGGGGTSGGSGSAGGSNGTGGLGGSGDGGGGGGLTGNGGGGGDYPDGGGRAFINGGAGGRGYSSGSFGGGGSGSNVRSGGGGGGGYSGGGGGTFGVGGGGGSYTAGSRLVARTGATEGNSGDGLVIISYTTQLTRYVKATATGTGDGSSWDNASGDLQAMIDIAGVRQVWVAGGRYTPTANFGSFSLKNGVAVYGGFMGSEGNLSQRPGVNPVAGQVSSTTLSVNGTNSSVIFNTHLDQTAGLDGVIITGGKASSVGLAGGIFNGESSPTLTNCMITGNSGVLYAGGISNASSSPTLINCVIRNNSSSTQGGGIKNVNSNPTLINCVIRNNSSDSDGGGVYNDQSSPTLTNCVIRDNSAQAGGGVYNDQSSPTLTNCLLAANSAEVGGGLYNENDSNPRLLNSTLTANRTVNMGRGSNLAGAALINYAGSQPVLVNTILFDNQESDGSAIVNETGTGVTANYSLIGQGESDFTGSNNLTATASPFVGGTDYRLRAGSPAIDAGDPNANSGSTDLAGNPRVANGRIDIGAYEFQGPFCQPIAITQQPASGSSVCVGRNLTAMVSVTGTNPTYQWYKDGVSLGTVQQSATLTLTNVQTSQSGSYSVVVTGSCNSVTSTAFSLSVNPLPVATLTASPSTVLSCAQTSLTLTAGSGTSYIFSGPGVVRQQGSQAVVNAPGTYSVTVTSSGCSSTTSLAISQDNTAPSASLASSGTLSCSTTGVTLTASPGGQSYRFSSGATQIGTTNQATVTTAGTYSVTVISGNGCSSVASTTVTGDQTPPTVSITPTSGTLTCQSPSLTLTANTSASTLRWSNGQTTPSITVRTAGTYSVTATGSNGCSATSNSVLIESSQSTPPATLIASGDLSCAVTSVTLTANIGSGLSYRFSLGATQVGTGNTATVNVASTYSVTVTNTATGCTNTASIVVNQDNSQPTVSITPSTTTLTCAVPTATLTANTSASSLIWSTGQTTSSISVSVAGTYSVTVTSANGCMAMAQAIVSGTTDAPNAPTLSASPATTTTTNQPITITANGCTGGTINWTALGGSGQANGNTYSLTQPGNYTLSATCSLNGCTSGSSASLSVQIRPGGFAITGVSMVNCQLIDEAKGGYQVQFTPQYAGQTNSPISFSVVNELANTTAPAPYSLRLYTDNPVITLVATQAGSGEARFAYNWLASCQSGTSPNQPPTTTGIPSQTILVGQGYQLQLTSYFTDPDGQALSFQTSGLPAGLSLSGSVISGTPSQTGVSSVSITALDPGGLQVSTSFQLTVSPMPVSPPTGFAIVGISTVSCQVLSAGERRLTFTPQYAGVNGAPISFSVVNELVATTNPGPYTLNLYTDNPTITLSAQQGSAVATYRYNWLAGCTPAARVGSGEAGLLLQVKVLGNPVTGNTAEVEISGVTGQAVQLNLVDLQGKSVHTQRIEQAGAIERVSLPLGASNGVLLLQVSTPTQHQQVKLLRTN